MFMYGRIPNMRSLLSLFLLLSTMLLQGCQAASPVARPTSPSPSPAPSRPSFSVIGSGIDAQILEDIGQTLKTNATSVCTSLQTPCTFDVMVEVYADQADFDEHVMNPDMRGFYAISGVGRIQMVSPANPAPHQITYADGVSIALHEFVHLALDEIEPDLPTWLDEGTAIYLGPHAIYDQACHGNFPVEYIPSLNTLITAYDQVPAADLFAYTAVAYLVRDYQLVGLNALFRGASLESISGLSLNAFEENWKQYLSTECSK